MAVGRKRTLREKWRLTSLSNKTITIATVVIAFSGVLTFGAAFFQWREMVGAGKQTDRIIAADERFATAMENSVKEAGKSLDATIAQNQLDQRAWVGSVQTMRPEDLIIGGKPRFGVWAANTGKTPALNFKFLAIWTAAKKSEPFRPDYRNQSQTQQSAITMFPNMKAPIYTPRSAREFTQSDINDLTSGNWVIWIYGKMSYDDIFGKTHHSTFCLWVGEDLTSTNSCETYNNAD